MKATRRASITCHLRELANSSLQHAASLRILSFPSCKILVLTGTNRSTWPQWMQPKTCVRNLSTTSLAIFMTTRRLSALALLPLAPWLRLVSGDFFQRCVWPRPRGPDSPHGFTIQKLVEMVNTLPHVATSLHIIFDPTSLEIMTPHIFDFTGILLRFTQISRFSLSLCPLGDFDSMKLLPFFSLSIPLVLRCSTLKHLELKDVPPSVICGNLALEHLVLCSMQIEGPWSMQPQTASPRAALEFLALDAGMNRMAGFIDCILMHNGLDLSGIKQLYINTGSRATSLTVFMLIGSSGFALCLYEV